MEIILTRQFKDDIKFYKRRKKYLKIEEDVQPVIAELNDGNLIGDKLEALGIPMNTSVYKVRLPNSSTNMGKSGGFRLLYYVALADRIYVLKIYSKKDDNRIPTDALIVELIKTLLNPEQSQRR